jgi:hypothetical protein
MIVFAPQLALPHDAALPSLDLGHNVGQEPQAVVWRQDRRAQHVTEHSEHEQRLHRGADLQRMLSDLVADHPVQELAQRLVPLADARCAIVLSMMTELIGVTAVAIVAWFAAGTIWNIRKGSELLRWMQGGLPALGERTTVRWLGSTAVEMVIRDAKPPFTGVMLVIFLEARDLPWMWAFGRSGGRRDMLIVRGALRRIPEIEFEALDTHSWSGRDALRRVPREWPIRQATASGSIVVHHGSAAALAQADALLALAQGGGLRVGRMSVRRTEPNFQLHVPIPDRRQSARDFFEAVNTLAERVLA